MALNYESPDAKSMWRFWLDLIATTLVSVVMIANAIASHWAAATFLALVLIGMTLLDIHQEVRATRRLTELSTLRTTRLHFPEQRRQS